MTNSHSPSSAASEGDISERLRKEAFEAVDWNGETMKQWDKIRALCAERDGSDLPRLMFESLIDSLSELMIDGANEIDRLRQVMRAPAQAVGVPAWESLTAIIRPMIESVCSDGNSNSALLAKDIANAILAAVPPAAPVEIDVLSRLVDWTYLHATEGETWPSSKTKADLITRARQDAPRQEHADGMKAVAPQRSSAATERDDYTCYVERSKVRTILLEQPDVAAETTSYILHDIDQLPIFTAEDFRAQPQPAVKYGDALTNVGPDFRVVPVRVMQSAYDRIDAMLANIEPDLRAANSVRIELRHLINETHSGSPLTRPHQRGGE